MKTFRLELRKGGLHLKGKGEPVIGDLIAVSASIGFMESKAFLLGKDLTSRGVPCDLWPTKQKPFSVLIVTNPSGEL